MLQEAAAESRQALEMALKGTDMVFVTVRHFNLLDSIAAS